MEPMVEPELSNTASASGNSSCARRNTKTARHGSQNAQQQRLSLRLAALLRARLRCCAAFAIFTWVQARPGTGATRVWGTWLDGALTLATLELRCGKSTTILKQVPYPRRRGGGVVVVAAAAAADDDVSRRCGVVRILNHYTREPGMSGPAARVFFELTIGRSVVTKI